jgi:hypothetical membrane protein
MTRGAQQAPNPDTQTGNGPAHPRSSPAGRGRMRNWIRPRTCTRARNRIRAINWIRAGNGPAYPRSSPTGRARTSAWIRAGAIAGVVGPVAFTAAWISGALRQPGLSFATPQISGLAAENARDPWLMITGFELLGGCAIGFGAALRAALGGRQAGPAAWLIQLAGVLTIATGLLRRDHVLLTSGPESWHNEAHNVISAVAYALLIVAPLMLAWRLRRDRQWSRLAPPLVASAVLAAAFLAGLYAAPNGSWAATLQRVGVSLPLAAIVAVALRLTRLAASAGRPASGGASEE